MNRSGEDNRSVRNTKRKLRAGLITLLSEKPLNEISVKELTDFVDVNRGTFYFHYSDIYDMLSKIEDEFFERFDSILNDPDPDMRGSANEYLTAIFSFLGENHDLCEILLGPHGDMQFVNRVKSLIDERCSDLWREHASQSSVWKYEMKNAFIVNGCVGLMNRWLADGLRESPEEIAGLAASMILTIIKTEQKPEELPR